MWARQSHKLVALTKITYSKVKYGLTKVKGYDFEEIKWTVARNTLRFYPDFNEEFKIHINASEFQL